MRFFQQLSLHQRILFVAGILILGLLVFLGFSPAARHFFSFSALQEYVGQYGAYAPIAFMAVYVVAAVCFVPASPFMLAAGLLFGAWRGFWFLVIADMVAAVISYGLARSFGRPIVLRIAQLSKNPLLRYEERLTQRHGWRMVLLLRVLPLFPFPVLNYALGLTSVRLRPYVAGTFFGVMPATFAYVYFGDAIAQLRVAQLCLAIVCFFAVVAMSWYLKNRHNTPPYDA